MSVIESVLQLQELDCRIKEMERELADIPARKQREQARLDEHLKEVEQAEHNLKGKQAEIKKIEGEAEGHREKIRKLRQQQFEIKTNKEFKAIESEIAAIQAAISRIEDLELALMLDVEAARGALESKRRALAEEQAAVQADVAALDQRAAALRTEVEGLRVQRQSAVAAVAPDWLAQYERIAQRRDRALVPIEEGGICGGCHMQLPPYVLHDARKRTAIVTCGFCGRMVY